MNKSSSIYETFSPLYKALKLFGIIPFKMSLKEGKVTMGWLDVLLMLAFWVFWTYLIVCNLIFEAREVIERSNIILNGWHWILIFEIASSFFIQIVSLLRRNSIGTLFRILDEVDSMVSTWRKGKVNHIYLMISFQNSTMYYRENHTEFKDLTLRIMLGSLLIHISIGFFSVFAMAVKYPLEYKNDYYQHFGFFYVTCVYILTYHKFIFVTSSIRTRFKLLNMNLMFVQLNLHN